METSKWANNLSVGHTSEDNVNWNYGRIPYWQPSPGNCF